ncbi:MAG: hypothetical protein ABSF15_24310 [Candidatus Sulfotelmatobacter sp.]|jgi:hypothetical protein
MCEKFSAVFERRNGNIEVFSIHHCRNGYKTYLGMLDLAEEFDYEGKYVFNLDTPNIEGPLHIPVNVLREIADYGTSSKADLSDVARSKRKNEARKRS